MPSSRKQPPKSVVVTITKSTKANGANVFPGEVVKVTKSDASLLVYNGMAERGEKKPKRKVSRSKPAVDAQR